MNERQGSNGTRSKEQAGARSCKALETTMVRTLDFY